MWDGAELGWRDALGEDRRLRPCRVQPGGLRGHRHLRRLLLPERVRLAGLRRAHPRPLGRDDRRPLLRQPARHPALRAHGRRRLRAPQRADRGEPGLGVLHRTSRRDRRRQGVGGRPARPAARLRGHDERGAVGLHEAAHARGRRRRPRLPLLLQAAPVDHHALVGPAGRARAGVRRGRPARRRAQAAGRARRRRVGRPELRDVAARPGDPRVGIAHRRLRRRGARRARAHPCAGRGRRRVGCRVRDRMGCAHRRVRRPRPERVGDADRHLGDEAGARAGRHRAHAAGPRRRRPGAGPRRPGRRAGAGAGRDRRHARRRPGHAGPVPRRLPRRDALQPGPRADEDQRHPSHPRRRPPAAHDAGPAPGRRRAPRRGQRLRAAAGHGVRRHGGRPGVRPLDRPRAPGAVRHLQRAAGDVRLRADPTVPRHVARARRRRGRGGEGRGGADGRARLPGRRARTGPDRHQLARPDGARARRHPRRALDGPVVDAPVRPRRGRRSSTWARRRATP